MNTDLNLNRNGNNIEDLDTSWRNEWRSYESKKNEHKMRPESRRVEDDI